LGKLVGLSFFVGDDALNTVGIQMILFQVNSKLTVIFLKAKSHLTHFPDINKNHLQ
jgi:hypothetical protein